MQIKLTNGLSFIWKGLIKGIMRAFIFLFSIVVFSLNSNNIESQNTKIKIEEDRLLTIDELFDLIMAQTDYKFIYPEGIFKGFPEVHVKKGSISTNKLLRQSISMSDLRIIVTKNNTILIREKTSITKGSQRMVSGTVIDEGGLPIPGATVLIKGTTKGTATDIDGHYNITVPDPANVLVFTSLGFETREIMVGNQKVINVSLKESISQLDEVTINAGYYNTTQRETPGSIFKIDAKTIEKQPVSNPLSAMQGYIPGVNITQDSGTPGGGFNIEIRGKNFLRAGTDPLYLVDGIPYNSEPLGDLSSVQSVLSGLPGGNISPLNLINPADIESIEVLKDADATAIYGARGANGVVLITTKKGKTGKTQIKLNVSTSLASVPHSSFLDLMNTEQYLEMRLEAVFNDGYTLETLPEAIKRRSPDLYVWDQDRYTDWQEVLIGKTAYRNTAQLSFSGGNEQTRFLFSGSYQNETTVFKGDSNYGKASVHSSINHQSTNDRFHVSVTTDYVADDKLLPANNFTRLAYQLAPNAPALYDENGNLNWENSTWHNPLAYLERKFRTQSSNLLLNTVLSYRLMPDLELKTSLGYTDYHSDLYHTIPHTSFDPSNEWTSTNSVVITNNVTSKSWIVEPQLNWKTDWGKASLNMLVGATFQQRQSTTISHRAIGFPSNEQILDLSAADQLFIDLDQDSEYKYQAIFGRLNFKWDDTYIINLTGRRDGSSRFGPGRQFGNFGAVGVAWLFSEEAFLEHNNLLSFGKLRTSYGITGSDANIGDYGFYDSYETSEENYGSSGLEPARLYNPIFAWEENKKFEVALELGFFKNRFMLTTAWYRNRSSNQLTGIPLPSTTGFAILNSNFDATVENTGLEIDFRSINIQSNDFKWTTIFNMSVPKNKLVKFDGLENSTLSGHYVVGEPLSIVKLFHTTGVNPDTGVYEFEDYNNDGVITPGFFSADRQWVEHTAPKFYGGLGNTITYKNWTLDAFFQFKKHRANIIQTIIFVPGTLVNRHVSVLNRWQQVGDESLIQRYTIDGTSEAALAHHEFYSSSNASYTDASFIRLRNVTLTYALPKDVIHGLDASIYLQGQNLLTFTKFIGPDPDQANNQDGHLPVLRQFTLGLQLGF